MVARGRNKFRFRRVLLEKAVAKCSVRRSRLAIPRPNQCINQLWTPTMDRLDPVAWLPRIKEQETVSLYHPTGPQAQGQRMSKMPLFRVLLMSCRRSHMCSLMDVGTSSSLHHREQSVLSEQAESTGMISGPSTI